MLVEQLVVVRLVLLLECVVRVQVGLLGLVLLVLLVLVMVHLWCCLEVLLYCLILHDQMWFVVQ